MDRRAFAKLAKAAGVEAFVGDSFVDVIAPAGKVFACRGVHQLTTARDGWRLGEIFDELADDLAYGLADCAAPDCDFCADSHIPNSDAAERGADRIA
jgi:hypothetical protein